MASEQEWVNAVKGDEEFGLLRYQLTFTDDGDYGPIKYTVRIRGVDLEGTVTPQEIGATMGGTWWRMIEDHLRREHHLPACDRRSPEQKRIADLEGALETIGGADKATLARKLRRVNAENRALRAERDEARRANERLAGEIEALREMLREAHGHLSIGLNVWDEIDDYFAAPSPAGDDAGGTR